MKPVNVNGVLLSEETLDELYFLQTGSSQDVPSDADNSGLNLHMAAMDNLTNFLIERRDSLGEKPETILSMLGDLNFLRNYLKRFSVSPNISRS